MAKFKEWFYKKISEDSVSAGVSSPLNFQQDLAAATTKQKPAGPDTALATNPNALAQAVLQKSSPTVRDSFANNKMIKDIVAQQMAAQASNNKTNQTQIPSNTFSPAMSPGSALAGANFTGT
jgi:hypothetical protein